MDENFLLSNDTAINLYNKYAKDMPIIDYHCHLNPKEIFENKIKEVIENVSVPPSGEMEIRLLESESPAPRRRISDEAGSKSGRSRSAKKSKTDEFKLHKLMRESPERT